jgi:hypothetical protein
MKTTIIVAVLYALPVMSAIDNPFGLECRACVGDIDMPPAISNATTMQQLLPIITNNAALHASGSAVDFVQDMAAIRRLGQLGGDAAIHVITSHFYAIPYHYVYKYDDGTFPAAKTECIRALGRMNSDAARDALLAILQDYWRKGPRPPNTETSIERKGPRTPHAEGFGDREFGRVIGYAALYLNRWADDSNVYACAQAICTSPDFVTTATNNPFFYLPMYWDQMYALYLRGWLPRMGITSEWQILTYVAEQNQLKRERDKRLANEGAEDADHDDYMQMKARQAIAIIVEQISTNTMAAAQTTMMQRLEAMSKTMIEVATYEWVDGEKKHCTQQPEAYYKAERERNVASSMLNTIESTKRADEARKGKLPIGVPSRLYLDEANMLEEIRNAP